LVKNTQGILGVKQQLSLTPKTPYVFFTKLCSF
jgi:hypothetical protein